MSPRLVRTDGAFLHLFHEVAVRLLGAVQRVDLIAAGALDDQGVDLAMPNRAQHLFGFGEAHAQRLGLFAIVGVACVDRLTPHCRTHE